MAQTTLITRREWQTVAGVALVLAVITSLPYLVGFLNAPQDTVYSGFVMGVSDGYSYIAKIRLGLMGNWSFYIFYTDEPHAAAPLTYLPYILPGQLLRLFISVDTPNLYAIMMTVYHGMRVVFGAVLVFTIYRFTAVFIESPAARLLTLIIAVAGGGWGWLLLAGGITPPEWLIPEGFGFHLLYILPHLPLARAAMLGGFLWVLAAGENRIYALFAGILWYITGVTAPFYLVVIYAILGVWGLLLWVNQRAFPVNAFIRALIAGGVTLPLFGFYGWVFSTNTIMAQWGAQNILPSPPPYHYLLAYGALVAFGALAVPRIWQERDERGLLLLGWVVVGLLLIYAPVNVQRRLGEGVLVALAILAVRGIEEIAVRRSIPIGRLRVALLVLTLPTTLLLYIITFTAVALQDEALYANQAEITAMQWLDQNALERERGAVVLTRYDQGNMLPAYAGLRTYIGHGPETLDYAEKERIANAYFDDQVPENTRAALYRNHRIEYVFFGVNDTPPAWAADELILLYDEGGVQVYAVGITAEPST